LASRAATFNELPQSQHIPYTPASILNSALKISMTAPLRACAASSAQSAMSRWRSLVRSPSPSPDSLLDRRGMVVLIGASARRIERGLIDAHSRCRLLVCL
jgi:hypothetical protein